MLNTLDSMNTVLLASLGSEELVIKWWESRNKAFDGKTPWDMLHEDPDRVQNYLHDFLSAPYL